MQQIKDVVAAMKDLEVREDVEKTIDECMKKIGCENVDWRNFYIYDSSVFWIENILSKMQIFFFIPIAEAVKNASKREVILFCSKTKEKEDRIWTIRVNATQLHVNIYISPKTAEYLNVTE